MLRLLCLLVTTYALVACTQPNDETLFLAKSIVTLDDGMDGSKNASAVIVQKGVIKAVGEYSKLRADYPLAVLDQQFSDDVLVPGFIDPHVHMILGALIYSRPFLPPWDMETPQGIVQGLPSKKAFLDRLTEVEQEHKGKSPLIVYGYHNLVHGSLDRDDLDRISASRPVLVWHYSVHDFYLNSAALEWVGADESWAEELQGVELDASGRLTGRLFEQASKKLFSKLAFEIFTPSNVAKGFDGYEKMLAKAGVTSVAELGYGLFGKRLEDFYYWLEYSDDDPYHLYLVPEYREFDKRYGDQAVEKIVTLASNEFSRGVPMVLPQVKFFVDGAFYSQTMRLSEPGYLAGQSEGEEGEWATQPSVLTDQMKPYWQAGLDLRVHSNGDAAQQQTLSALDQLAKYKNVKKQRFVVEHAALLKRHQLAKIRELGGGVSAASHYVHYMGEAYQRVIGSRVKYLTPMASVSKFDIPGSLHSDAPLAPAYPLQAAAVHLTRSTREGGVSTPSEMLSKQEALKSITINAAWALGLDLELGSIEVGKRANFTVLKKNPLDVDPLAWSDIEVVGVVLDGEPEVLHAGKD